MKDDSYVVIQAFMLNDLELKGNELIVYATIYGFTQDGEHWFYGTKGYLAEWCGATKGTVGNCLKSLVAKGLLERREKTHMGQTKIEYRAVKNANTPYKNCDTTHTKIAPINNLEEQSNQEDKDIPYADIIDYLNTCSGKRFRCVESTRKVIRARWGEGYTFDDFRHVIEVKCAEWLGTDMEKYVRPQTLFGTKMEAYANQPVIRSRAKEGKGRNDEYDLENRPDSSKVTHQQDAYDWNGYDDIRF